MRGHSQSHYFDEMVKTKCGADLLATGFFPNAKEVTESFAAYSAVRRHLWARGFRPSDPDVTAVMVGDGTWPRTAATFAFRSAWSCVSIDPLAHVDAATKNRDGLNIKRLSVTKAKIEDVSCDFYNPEHPLLIVCVHSHAPMPAVLAALPGKHRAVVAIPCCVPQEIPHAPLVEYRDTGILSPCNLVKIWPTA